MVHILITFPGFSEARHLVNRLVAAGIPREQLTIADECEDVSAVRVYGLVFAMLVGVLIALIVPNHYLTHLTFGLHLIGLVGVRMVAGAATGGAIEWLFQQTLFRRIATTGAYAVAIEADWETVQRARRTYEELCTYRNERLLRLVQAYGYEHQSFLSLYDGGKVWFQTEPEAAVVYRCVGKVAIVTAAPLAAREHWESVTRAFLQYCMVQNLDCLMLPVGQDFAQVAQACGMGILRVGESGFFQLPQWKPAGDRAKKVRAGVNQARGAGITVKPFYPKYEMESHTRAEIEQLCQQWLASREINALGWLLELKPFALAEHKRYFLARNTDGRLEGLLACSPFAARRGWYLEDLLRRQDAPRGVSELLVVEALQHLAAEGAALATLGTSPLAGVKPEGQFNWLARLLRLLYEHFDSFYHFKQLHRFKAKFAPSFVEAEYVAVWPPHVHWRMVYAALNVLDPNGLTGMATAKLRKLWQRARR